MDKQAWKVISCLKSELRLDYALEGGQSFRWQKHDKQPQWTGVFADKIWTLKQSDDKIFYRVFPESVKIDDDEYKLRDYFQLGVNLQDLFSEWSKSDVHFESLAVNYAGVRVLRQDPVENLFSFLCSSNNNIKRITSMVEKLCTLYGKRIGQVDGRTYHGFPKSENMMADSVEDDLKEHKFGYRAAYIVSTARRIAEQGGDDWVRLLREKPYAAARKELLTLTGVGPKVADCVCLMSLDKTESVPIDTHMFQIAAQTYLPALKAQKTLTEKAYVQIGDHFRSLFGVYAGWAHSVLFTSDLKQFSQPPSDSVPRHQLKICSPCDSSNKSKRQKISK